jgi:hypothetical protein
MVAGATGPSRTEPAGGAGAVLAGSATGEAVPAAVGVNGAA